jgi:hypothetical protein
MPLRNEPFDRLITLADEDEQLVEDVDEYGWFLNADPVGQPERVPDLAWVWDLGSRALLEYQLAVAARQPFGNA